MKILETAFALLILTSFAVSAQEGGSVMLVFEGESYEFPLSAEQSDWGGSQAYFSASISARPTDKEVRALFRGLGLGFEFTGGSSASAAELDLRRVVDGELQKLFGNGDTGAVVTVEETQVVGKFLTVTGSFASDMGTSSNYGRDIDLSDPVAVSGTFSVTLGPVE